ncbi:MAG: hypothetical protein U0575_03185 [Phycisphaerales bacterium]
MAPRRTSSRRLLAAACHVVAALVLLAPIAVAILVEDKTHAAIAAVIAVLSFRFLAGELAPWLDGEG